MRMSEMQFRPRSSTGALTFSTKYDTLTHINC